MSHNQTEPSTFLPHISAHAEIWGGAEYTCNRVHNRYFDQTEFSGHLRRTGDLDLVAELGIIRLRIGVLWERHQDARAWFRTDRYLARIRELRMRPIAGLLHHGSGPAHTSLLDPDFPQKLASFAGSVAQRYPWIDAYTPINEPHTTARFSAMYGVWYPHHMDRRSYLRALLLQMKATVLSMRAIRLVRGDAKLVQTDDLGSVRGSSQVRHVAELMNERRWLPWDLLCGRVDRTHAMFEYLTHSGCSERDVLWFADNPCPADVIGVNYYATSDRFLDHRLWLYPPDRRSAEGEFVDIEAVRVEPLALSGFGDLLTQAWNRYGSPVAITEVHLGGEVDQQVRWAAEAWIELNEARRRGVNCVAMTFWALFGSYFWNCLVTAENGHYEPGVFDISSGSPAPTALAELVHDLAHGRPVPAHAMACAAWWRDPGRFSFSCEEAAEIAA